MKKILLVLLAVAMTSVLSLAQDTFSFETYDNGYLITFKTTIRKV